MTQLSRRPAYSLFLRCAGVLGLLVALPTAHAQFSGLFQNIMQMQQQQQAAESQKKAAVQKEMESNPIKKWGAGKSPAADVQTAATGFAAATKVAQLRPLFERLYIEGERNATLNFQRIGLVALALGETEIAEKSFDAAVSRIELIYADNPEAQKAKSLWTAEKVKDFKGEPYERAMAYFYRGLVYAAKGDFQNARAMFKQADYQDTVAESEQYAGDFALMPYMAGWASYCDGNPSMAKDFLQQAIKADKAYESVPIDRPLLVLFETGQVPFKYGGGKFGEALKWKDRPLPRQVAKSACVAEGKQCTDAMVMAADVSFQATTRGGRPVDGILNGKASFKEGAQNVAEVATTVGAIGLQTAAMTGNRDAAGLGMIGMFAGLVAQSASNSTQAQADIREWEQLPGNVWLGLATAKAESVDLTVGFESDGTTSHVRARRLVNAPSCQLYWGRSIAPESSSVDAGPIDAGEHKRDPVFRQELLSMF